MSATFKCHHPELSYAISTIQTQGDSEIFVHARIHCPACGTRFRFLGVPQNHDSAAPTCDRTNTEVILPITEVAL